MRVRLQLLACIVALAVAATAGARPPALLWQAQEAPPAEAFAALVVERDAGGVRLLSARVAEGPCKLKARGPDGRGLLFVLRDAAGRPLLLGETFDGALEVHGDEPDPVTSELRSLSAPIERTAFGLRVPLLPGAHDVALYEGVAAPADEILSTLRERPGDLALLGVVKVPSP